MLMWSKVRVAAVIVLVILVPGIFLFTAWLQKSEPLPRMNGGPMQPQLRQTRT